MFVETQQNSFRSNSTDKSSIYVFISIILFLLTNKMDMHVHICHTFQFRQLTSIVYDIMVPFRWVPGMECRHSVFSMKHSVNGEIRINGKSYLFHHGTGYWEGDRGRSFPEK